MKRRVGILGGTFDPIHCGHLDLAAAVQQGVGLTSLLVIPANIPPHRPTPSASSFHRFAMTAIAVAARPGWQASDLELVQPSPSYTDATLTRLHRDGFSASDLYFVIGADAFADIRSWKNYPAILDRTNFAVVSRPGSPVQALRQRLPELAVRMKEPPGREQIQGVSIFLIDAPTADVSSTAIRQRRQAGQTITGLVPPGVEQHIEQHGLYRSISPDTPHDQRPMDPAAGRLHGQS
jgi:nicotinate-nucleotide adenylyltransferase